ncbi:unnamed protein product [Rotaria magnacalcarata]|uniref:Uncharacterized protein n=3 Tax=Rotaria magnacalcarata TaxID=392030 RepID=A0A819DTE8_9BILA|nr:unnamed protein product [Rotaria magnacalcarata]CAF2060560.1 unnamed protein product [Rotaria magnacalcarata]CAF2092879.1 unnamed protein product [Rotaria magnacalcarata]CAF2124224.1 unnamed protein product [Rotaria magnacalcarata]CAF3833702.1 unnamed protein product [Rotaria magnacalcarata]
MSRFLIITIWLIANYQLCTTANLTDEDFSIDAVIKYERELILNNTADTKIENPDLSGDWQDWVLSNIIAVNYLNSLMIVASRQDFAFSIPSGYAVRYIENSSSFHRTVSQLTTKMRGALTNAREDLNRVHTGMERVPDNLKTMVLLMKQAPFELLLMLFPDSFDDIERLVNDSLIVLRRPKNDFEQVLNLITEIDHLLNIKSNDPMLYLQVFDLKTQWTYLTTLVTELSQRAERTRESFLLQFNWILKEFIRPDLSLSDSNRDFMIALLLPKIIELDQTSDLLGTITKTYTDISYRYTDEQLGSNGHLLTLSKEEDRKRYLKQFQSELVTHVVPSARLALQRHTELLQRDKTRRGNFEKLLTGALNADLISSIG